MKNDKDLLYKSVAELVSLLTNRKISSVALLDATISRIETLDKKLMP